MGCAAAHPILIRFIDCLTLYVSDQLYRGSIELGVTNGTKVVSSSMISLDILILSNIAILLAIVFLFITFVLIIVYFFVIILCFYCKDITATVICHFFSRFSLAVVWTRRQMSDKSGKSLKKVSKESLGVGKGWRGQEPESYLS